MSTGRIQLDDRHWPLVVVVYEGSPSKSSFDAYLADMDRCLARKQRHGYLLDGREGAMLDGPQRNAQGAWLKQRKDALRLYSAGTGLVVRSAAARFLVSAIYLIQPPVAPTSTFTAVDDAYLWLETIFAKERLALAPRGALGI